VKRRNKEPRIVDHVSDSDDEEIPEDEAFNSDDERKYGAFFEKSNKDKSDGGSEEESSDSDEESDSEEEDGLASDDEDSEGDGGQYMLDLLAKLDSSNNEANQSKSSLKLASSIKESEFSSSVVQGKKLTLDALMEGLEDTKGFGVMQKTMKDVAQGQTTSAPVAKKVSDRAQRKVHYEEQSEEIARWIDAVKQNREAESLDFRPKERMKVTREELVDKFVPTTDFEKELSDALEKTGQIDEEAILKKEQALLAEDDLGSNKITIEEYQKRRGQLAKIRALMFYHEQKRHHINKIKSKKYRRIRKKQRERQKEAEVAAQIEDDPDLARELEEKEEVDRMKERMTLAHKNTSKWAKRVLKRGKNVDVDTRRALSAQLKRGDDLRKKMGATRDQEDEEDDDEDLAETARKVLADTEDDSEDPAQTSGLFKLSFMQRGIEKQRQQAKDEARQLLNELESNKLDDASEDESEVDSPVQKKTPKIASEAEMKDVLQSGQLVASSLELGKSNSISVSGGIDIDISLADKNTKSTSRTSKPDDIVTPSGHTSTFEVTNDPEKGENAQTKQSEISLKRAKAQSKRSAQTSQLKENEEVNPWMSEIGPKNGDGGSSKKKRKTIGKNGVINVEGAADLVANSDDKEPKENKEEKENRSSKKISSLTQEELVRRAFAAPTNEEVDEEFAKEKEAMVTRDDPTRKQQESSKEVSGWGSWAGEGAPLPKPARKLPKHLKPPEKKLPKRKRQDEKRRNVIINEKRVKKTSNNYQIANIPYPYTSREEYERAMAGGVGSEWNTTGGVKNMTRSEILTRAGKIIQPLSKKVKVRRAPAKF